MCHARPGIWSFGMTVKFTYSMKGRKPSTSLPCPTAILFFFYHSQFFKCTIHHSTPFSHYYTLETSYWHLHTVFHLSVLWINLNAFSEFLSFSIYISHSWVYPATQEFSSLACGVLLDHFLQFLAFLYWSCFSSPQEITLMSWFYPVFFCIYLYLPISIVYT